MAPFPVLVHRYDDNSAVAYEHVITRASPSSSSPPRAHAIIFIAGLGEGPHDISFVRPIATRVTDGFGPSSPGGWSVFECRLRSSFGGYAFSSLRNDAEDLAVLVRYLRDIGREKIVLMGHSTGSQACVEYASLSHDPPLPPVDGYILQGSVSDREGHPHVDAASLAKADELIAAGNAHYPMPMDAIQPMFGEPISAYRFRSLLAVGGDDDFFSSDLSPTAAAQVWTRFKAPVLIAYSEQDQCVPSFVDKAALVATWRALNPAFVSELSGLIPGASHGVEEEDAQEWLAERVARFLETV